MKLYPVTGNLIIFKKTKGALHYPTPYLKHSKNKNIMESNSGTLGIVTLLYNEDGTVNTGMFKPTMDVDFTPELATELHNIPCNHDVNIIKDNAEVVLSAWFSKINKIELADRDEYTIKSGLIDCERYPSGMPWKCKFSFTFAPLK